MLAEDRRISYKVKSPRRELCEVAMKILSQLMFGVVCAGIGAGICVGQERTSVGAAAAAAGGTRSIVQGRSRAETRDVKWFESWLESMREQ